MAFSSETKFPSRRTYVVKVRSDARPDSIAGRLENVVTGRQRDFNSDRELVESIARDLGEAAPERAHGEDGAKP